MILNSEKSPIILDIRQEFLKYYKKNVSTGELVFKYMRGLYWFTRTSLIGLTLTFIFLMASLIIFAILIFVTKTFEFSYIVLPFFYLMLLFLFTTLISLHFFIKKPNRLFLNVILVSTKNRIKDGEVFHFNFTKIGNLICSCLTSI